MLFHFTHNPRSPLISWSKTMAVVDASDREQARQTIISLFGIDPDSSMCFSCGPNLLIREIKDWPDTEGWSEAPAKPGVRTFIRGSRRLYLVSC